MFLHCPTHSSTGILIHQSAFLHTFSAFVPLFKPFVVKDHIFISNPLQNNIFVRYNKRELLEKKPYAQIQQPHQLVLKKLLTAASGLQLPHGGWLQMV